MCRLGQFHVRHVHYVVQKERAKEIKSKREKERKRAKENQSINWIGTGDRMDWIQYLRWRPLWSLFHIVSALVQGLTGTETM